MKKILIVVSVVLIVLTPVYSAFYYLESQYRKNVDIFSIPNGGIECRLFRGFPLQAQTCIRNLNKLQTLERDINVVLKTLCTSGNSNICYLQSQFVAFNHGVGTNDNPTTDLDTVELLCRTGVNKRGELLEYFDRNSFCSILNNYASATGAVLTQSIVKQTNCLVSLENCNNEVKNNILFSLEDNKILFNSWCISDNSKFFSYCSKLKNIISFQNKFIQIEGDHLNGKPRPFVFGKMLGLCNKERDFCTSIINEPKFLQEMILKMTELDLNFYDSFNLDILASAQISRKLLGNNLTANYKNRGLNFFLNLANNHQSETLKICSHSENKRFCFLSVKTIHEAKEHSADLTNFCKNGDSVSCSYLHIIKYSDELSLKNEDEIMPKFSMWENIALDHLSNKSKLVVLFDQLNAQRYLIISILLFANLLFFAYLFYVYKKFEDIFKYIREEKIKSIVNKLKK